LWRRVPVFKKMFEKRMRGYRAMGYETEDSSRGGFLFPAHQTEEPEP
jgi:hypothetical protein